MFIEKKESWIFLAKKSYWKKFLVKIFNDRINNENILELTRKESIFIYNSQVYLNFVIETYNQELLKEVVFQSKLLNNKSEVIYCIAENDIKCEMEVIWWGLIQAWLGYGFPEKFIYNSNNIEGSRIPEEEVKKIIEHKKYKYKVKNEIREVENSIASWEFLNEKFIFNEANIKKLYHVLTKDLLQENWEKYPRWFKKVSNVVNNNVTTAPEKVSEEINSLINWYKSNKKNLFPLQ